jgi:hypothetical protein
LGNVLARALQSARRAFTEKGQFMKHKIVYFALVMGMFALSGCASLTNPVPVAGQPQTAKQKTAQEHQSGVETFLSEVI